MPSLDFDNAAQAAVAPQEVEAVLDWHVLPRRKARPLRFRGERLVHLEALAEAADLRHEIDLFQTEAGGFVVSVAQTGPDDIRRPLTVFAADSAEDIHRHVAGLDPTSSLPLPHALFDGGSLGEVLRAHEDFARRVVAAREGLDELKRRALAALT
ncbi:hypothetical protein M2322_004627 [Rhodoblastus acidophilus]|uniref:hypothetical protein n=1 Tax=Rhodoblastus acidophilus TaxID=1074 RepID=UPI002224B978|nr:hypothetical protein [Rhodoblastus acidophilus]MCW2319058.1 hypothetical protein [Rhodoblastus acidophilus]